MGLRNFIKCFIMKIKTLLMLKIERKTKMKKTILIAILFTLFLGLAGTCRAEIIIVNTPSGTSICTPIGSTSVICN